MILQNPTRNVLSATDALYAVNSTQQRIISPDFYSTSWTITNATLSVTSDAFINPLYYSIKFRPNNPSLPVVLTLSSIIPPDNDINASEAQFHCRVFSSLEESELGGSAGQVSCKLTNVASSTHATKATSLSIGKWTTIYSPVVNVGLVNTENDDIEFSVEMTFTDIGGFDIYLTLPMLINEFGFTKNTFVYNMRKFLPSFIWDKDQIGEYPNYAFAKLFHALTHYGSLSSKLYSRFYELKNRELPLNGVNNSYRYSQLINPEYVDSNYVDWLSQFNGTPIYKILTTSTSTNAIGSVDDSIAWQLENAYFGRNAGTFLAIKESAKQVLEGNKVIYTFPGGSFFQINVYTLLSETPGVTVSGDTSPEVVAMIEKTKPMGFVLNHEAYQELPLVLDDPTYGQLGGGNSPSAPGLG